MAKNSTTDTRINLWVYATEDGAPVYHVMHIGFFSTPVATAMVGRLNARGIAFHSAIANQLGRVDVVTCEMGPIPNPERIAATEAYEPRTDRHTLAEVPAEAA